MINFVGIGNRNIPGNISDVSTLRATIEELRSLGVNHAFALVDSGYCSEENILLLRKANIDFLTRLPAGRSLYKDLILQHAKNLESLDQACQYGKRALFIKQVKVDLYGSYCQFWCMTKMSSGGLPV